MDDNIFSLFQEIRKFNREDRRTPGYKKAAYLTGGVGVGLGAAYFAREHELKKIGRRVHTYKDNANYWKNKYINEVKNNPQMKQTPQPPPSNAPKTQPPPLPTQSKPQSSAAPQNNQPKTAVQKSIERNKRKQEKRQAMDAKKNTSSNPVNATKSGTPPSPNTAPKVYPMPAIPSNAPKVTNNIAQSPSKVLNNTGASSSISQASKNIVKKTNVPNKFSQGLRRAKVTSKWAGRNFNNAVKRTISKPIFKK